MSRIEATRTIRAPLARVFGAVADVEQLSRVLPHVVRVEFLSDAHRGVGTRFRETRRVGRKEATTELAVTEYVENERVRLVATDPLGTVWDSVFAVEPIGTDTRLTLTMDAHARRWLARCFNRLIRGAIRRGVERDLDLFRAYCEGQASNDPQR